jgi:hypothetical protein
MGSTPFKGAGGAQGRKPRGPQGYGTSRNLKGGGTDYSITVNDSRTGKKEIVGSTQRSGPSGTKKLTKEIEKVASSRTAGLKGKKLVRKERWDTGMYQGQTYGTGTQNPSARNKQR